MLKTFVYCGAAIALAISSAAYSATAVSTQCDKSCTFVLKDSNLNSFTIINKERAETRKTPWSTFKIPNSVIAIETGIVKNIDDDIQYDKDAYPIQDWWPMVWYESPINLKEAFKHSAVPIYQTLGAKIGEQKMNGFLEDFHYGNQDISSGVDNFWLNKSIKISAVEQVEFLQRLYEQKVKVSNETLAKLKQIMLVEETDNYKLYAKTGGGGIAKGLALGWYVGFVEANNNVYYFAVNVDGKSFSDILKPRIEVAREQLKLAGIL